MWNRGWISALGMLTAACVTLNAQPRHAVESRVLQQTVMVQGCGTNPNGAGIVMGDDDDYVYIATARHVVYDKYSMACGNAWVSFKENADLKFPLAVIDGNTDMDAAFCRMEKKATADGATGGKQRWDSLRQSFDYSLARDAGTLRRGDPLFAIGSQTGHPWFVTPQPVFFAESSDPKHTNQSGGSNEKLVCTSSPKMSQTCQLMIGASPDAVPPGLSGGPLCDLDGYIVGMVIEKSANDRATPINLLLLVFRKQGKVKLFIPDAHSVVKPRYNEISAEVVFPRFIGTPVSDGVGVGLHYTRGINRVLGAAVDTAFERSRYGYSAYGLSADCASSVSPSTCYLVKDQAVFLSLGLQVQPIQFRPLLKEQTRWLGGLYFGGDVGWAFQSESRQSPPVNDGIRQIPGVVTPQPNQTASVFTTEIGYRHRIGGNWGTRIGYRVYQPFDSTFIRRSSAFTLGLYTSFR